MASKINDVELSCNGIDSLINNDWDASEKLFKEYKDQSPLMHYCHSFITFLRAIMTFEEQLLEQAQKDLEATEKMCTESSKVFSSLKKAFGISSSQSSNQLKQLSEKDKANESKETSLEEKFTKAIILADCKLYLALLTFIRQEITGYLTNGILQIRKSWKLYAKIQKQLYELYKKIEPNAEQLYGSDPNSSLIQILVDDSDEPDDTKSSANNDSSANMLQLNELTLVEDEVSKSITPEAIKRLLGGVSFGYGVFQICLSFMPPNILKLVKILGFEGDRSVALRAINFTSNSKDMRAPFADMVLLWYSTVATPLFGLGESDLIIKDEETKLILEKNLGKYPKSSLFHYYKGKHMKSLKDISGALKCYDEAYENSKHIREIQHISIYEIGWIHMMSLDYKKALEQFDILSKESRWSKSFNSYICAILAGGSGNYQQANAYIKEALKIVASQTRKNNPVEVFAIKRLEYFKKESINEKANSKTLCELLVIELLFLWICLPFCQESDLKKMLEICDKVTDKKFIAMKCLFEGAINIELNNKDFGEQCLNEALARAESDKIPFGKYILPYTNYQLGVYSISIQEYDNAKILLNKAKDSYKDYELENRIQTQIKSAQRRLKNLIDGPKEEEALRAKKEQEEAEKKRKENEIKNFYVQ